MKRYKKPAIKEKKLTINFFSKARVLNNHLLGTELLAQGTPAPCYTECACQTQECACQTQECADCNCDCGSP